MGIWGVELYQNDTSLDVKNQFEEQFYNGKTVQEITKQLIEDFKSIMGNRSEEPLFWFALADTQWDFGVLLPEVKEQALHWIKEDISIRDCQTTSMVTIEQWKRTLADLQVKLLSPQPSIKKPVRKKLYKCQWNLGDAVCPQKEFIPHSKVNIISVSWKNFETKMINRYCEHNLRELNIYSNGMN